MVALLVALSRFLLGVCGHTYRVRARCVACVLLRGDSAVFGVRSSTCCCTPTGNCVSPQACAECTQSEPTLTHARAECTVQSRHCLRQKLASRLCVLVIFRGFCCARVSSCCMNQDHARSTRTCATYAVFVSERLRSEILATVNHFH